MWERRCSGLALRQYLQLVMITINIFFNIITLMNYYYIDNLSL